MTLYILKRLAWAIVLLFVISFLTFIIFYLLPSTDPALLRAGKNPDPALVEAIRKQLGLDKPWYTQFWHYISKAVTGDFGYSYQNNIGVGHYLATRVPATVSLAIGGAVVWLLVGIPIGILSAVKRGSLLDRLAMSGALVAISAPVYWLGLVSIFLFSSDIGVLHIFNAQGANYKEIWQDPLTWADTLILPWFVLATAFAAIYARFMRSSLVEVLDEDYIRTARAKGLSKPRVIFKHGVRAAITPVVTIFGLDLGILFGGAILTETVFNIPGIGRLAFDSIQKGDIPIVQGTVLIGASAIIIANLLVDIAYAFIDPRVRY